MVGQPVVVGQPVAPPVVVGQPDLGEVGQPEQPYNMANQNYQWILVLAILILVGLYVQNNHTVWPTRTTSGVGQPEQPYQNYQGREL